MTEEYECCHEAGHALVRVLIGDTLIAIRCCPSVSGDENTCHAATGRGTTDFRFKERRCNYCGRSVCNLTSDECYLRHGCRSDLVSDISLDPDCPDCTKYLTEHLAAIAAGGVATEILMGVSDRPHDSQCDLEEFNCFLEKFGGPSHRRVAIKKQAMDLAFKLINRERRAVLALTDALVSTQGNLDGKEAEKVVRSNLTGAAA